MSVRMMLQARAPKSFGATLSAATWTNVKVTPTNALCGVRLNNDGTLDRISFTTVTTYTYQYDWETGAGTGSDYEARWTNSSGTLSSGNEGTWLALNTAPSFYVSFTDNLGGAENCIGTLEIRAAASQSVLASAQFDITAEVTI